MSERRGGMRHRRPRLTRSADFDRVYRRGRSAATRSFVLYAFPSAASDDDERTRRRARTVRLGVSVGRRVGGAVERNRVKRLLREAFWALDDQLPEDHDFVVVARAGAAEVGEPGRAGRGAAELAELLGRLDGPRAGSERSEMAAASAARGADRSDQALPALDLTRAAAPVQVRADLLGLRGRGDPDVRPAARASCWRSGGCCAATRSATGGTTPSAPSACSDDASSSRTSSSR